jgi:hypothetical protein
MNNKNRAVRKNMTPFLSTLIFVNGACIILVYLRILYLSQHSAAKYATDAVYFYSPHVW